MARSNLSDAQLARQTELNGYGVIEDINGEKYDTVQISSRFCPPKLAAAMEWYVKHLMLGVRPDGLADKGVFIVELQLFAILTFVPTHWEVWTLVIAWKVFFF